MNDLRTRPMTAEQSKLWQRLEAFDFDDGRPLQTFAQRLAEENHWSLGFAKRVIDEYRRFLFLAVAAGHPVTPSHAVDEAWHLHLNYTRSYWERLCKDVLRQPLHHDPTRGGAAEDRKFADWYERTRQSYEEFFGHAPPADIWGAAKPAAHDFDPRSDRTAPRIGNFRPSRKRTQGVIGAIASLVIVAVSILVMAGTGALLWPLIIMGWAALMFVVCLRVIGNPTRRLDARQQASGACGGMHGGYWWMGACGTGGGGGSGGGGGHHTGGAATTQPATTMPADDGLGDSGGGSGGTDGGGGGGGSSCGGGGGGCGGGGCGGS